VRTAQLAFTSRASVERECNFEMSASKRRNVSHSVERGTRSASRGRPCVVASASNTFNHSQKYGFFSSEQAQPGVIAASEMIS